MTKIEVIKVYTHRGLSFIAFLLPFKNLPEANKQSEYKHTKTSFEEGENRHYFEALEITLRHWKENDDLART